MIKGKNNIGCQQRVYGISDPIIICDKYQLTQTAFSQNTETSAFTLSDDETVKKIYGLV